MPYKICTDDEAKRILGTVSSDLNFCWGEGEVPVEAQIVLADGGCTTLRRFVGLEESREGVRKVLGEQFNLKGEESAAFRLAIGDLLSAWESARIQHKRETELKVEKELDNKTKEATRIEVLCVVA